MKPALRVLGGLVALIFAAGDLAAQQQKVNQTLWVAPGGFVRLFQITGTIRVQGWDRDSMSIVGTVNTPLEGEYVVTPSKQGAKVSLWGPDETRAPASELTIRVPRKSELYVKTMSANVIVSDFDGGVNITTTTGDVEVAGRPTDVYVESIGGDINIGVTARTARLRTGSGQVTVRGITEDATVSTVTGAIFIMEARMKQARLESIEGLIQYFGELSGATALTMTNHSGNVELIFAGRTAVEVSVETTSGMFRDEYGVQLRPFLGKTRSSFYSFAIGPEPIATVNVSNFKGNTVVKKPPVKKVAN